MCKTAAAAQGPHAIESLKLGILILLIPTVVLFASVFLIAIYFRNPSVPDEL